MSHILSLAGDSAVRSVVSWAVGFVMGTFVVRGLKSLLKTILDQLDTSTPGGLTDVVDELKKQDSKRAR